ncbi:LOW QUALITY PROTEIN: nuclear receptor subfamily 0 group B member 2-like [Bufo gargarizans]|uniref:LOW QUALITY PROTEIN: nuclear receptor subfamily 0 group B member 2-like n=1 Tax=Bufo gargarizans TaxID=30331 RepID=UPI001CF5B621|nr:LOW QUALITY PROTEIN: nuclear receptor subfamily 0 group B member 2-like [Bufo gargarizans]
MACRSDRPGTCQCNRDPVNSILFQMLNSGGTSKTNLHQHICNFDRGCPCDRNRKVLLKNPDVTCKKASDVLLKTVTFIRNLPSFYQLLQDDQVLLVRQCWAPLFVLGLAQEQVAFEWEELSMPSLLKKILLNQPCNAGDIKLTSDAGVPFKEVQRLQMFLHKLWNLDICTKEYAYLKGMVLFNPRIRGMRFPQYVQTLQLEAQHTLMEFTSMMQNMSQVRFTRMLEALDILKTIDSKVITELFFRPISGEINLEELLLETLFFN